MTDNLGSARMAGPDREEPVSANGIIDKEIPVKASPPREKSPAATETTETNVSQGEMGGVSITPPDGGWGWFVVLASFMIHVIGELFSSLKKSLY